MSNEKTSRCQGGKGPQPGLQTPETKDGVTAPVVVYVSSEVMGHGDDELGAGLLKTFLDTLAQVNGGLSHVILVNAGVRLAVQGSAVLAQLRQLEELGAEVLCCGTCLNHFGIKDQLAVGSVSNMVAILEVLTQSQRIIKP